MAYGRITLPRRPMGQRDQLPPRTRRQVCRHPTRLVGDSAWSANLLAQPNAKVTIGGKDIPVTATLFAEPERTRIYREFDEMVRVYGVYEHRTNRTMRVFALTAS